MIFKHFNNTDDAIQYGQEIKGDSVLINKLRLQREILQNKVRQLLRDKREGEALFLASGNSQFTSEAIQEAIS
ncbi:MAG: hypothetical protein ACTSVV_10510 [Promethearchaeota archaeon]